MTKQVQLYDDSLGFEENKAQGPFGDYADLSPPYQNPGKPKYDFFGIPVYSPFGIAAGPLPNTKFISAALNKGFDIVTLKSVRTDTFPLNEYPQVRPVNFKGKLNPVSDAPITVAQKYEEPLAAANSFGIPSAKPEEWQPEMRKSFTAIKPGQALLAAFQGTARGEGREAFVQDHVKGIGLIQDTGANIIEINLSYPNEGEKVLACFDTEITTRIVQSVREKYPDIKLLIKIAYFSYKDQLAELVKSIGGLVDGISAINTVPAHIVNAGGADTFPGRPKAGVSGAPIKWAGLEMTSALYELRSKYGYAYKIIGIGGVLSAADFQEYQNAGADIVMSVTGAMWSPWLAKEIKVSL